jgi:hypothetical protein
MTQNGFSAVPLVARVMVLSAISVSWCFAGDPLHSASHQKQETQPSTPAADTTSAPKGEGCKLHPYTGATPLSDVQNYVPGEEDLRGGMTCTFSINSNLPLFTFHFAGQADNSFGNLDITEKTSSQVIQTIENTTDPGLIMPATTKDLLRAVDANFDGYRDLQLLSNCGATGNCSYDFYLYDPKTKQFVHNDFLTSLTTPSFDAAKKQVTTHSNSSASDWSTETYQFHDGQYTLIYRQESAWDRDRHVVTVNTYELRNGKMELTETESSPE